MLLWTIMPIDMVLDGVDKVTAYQEIDYAGLRVMVEKLGPEQCRIVRLLSTAPEDFLRPEVQPGCVLTFRAVMDSV
jgi:hypothetical protein